MSAKAEGWKVGEPYPHPLFRTSKDVWRCNISGSGPPFTDTIVAGSTPEQAHARALLAAAAPEMADALLADQAWWDFEDAGPQYPDGMTRDSAGGEDFWKAWYSECQFLCARAQELKRSALASLEVEPTHE